jgi:glycosyltransferase involved in cell wall biosynthesis
MLSGTTVALLIPARDEAAALDLVLASVPRWIDTVLVVDNGSIDQTASVARAHGARVVAEPVPGYGRACLAGLAELRRRPPEVVAFADADGSDDLSRLADVVESVAAGSADLALGRRVPVDRGAMSPQQRLGNRLATRLIRLLWGHAYRDLGPMRAISWRSLERLEMNDRGFGWTVQMQVRAITRSLRVREVDTPYRARLAGRSKISRTVSGSVHAGVTILGVIAREALRDRPRVRAVEPVAWPREPGGKERAAAPQ